MRRIELNGAHSKGRFILVDDEDYERVSAFKWYLRKGGNNFYATRTIYLGYENGKVKQTTTMAHIEVMGDTGGLDIDHIDHNGLNNQKSNLRAVPHSLNLQNRSANSNSNSRLKNIGKRGDRWTVRVSINGSSKWLGVFDKLEEAIEARDTYREGQLGDFA